MAKKSTRQQNWQRWEQDPRVEYLQSDGGLEIRIADGDGGYRRAGWCLLTGHDVDMTIRQLRREMEGAYDKVWAEIDKALPDLRRALERHKELAKQFAKILGPHAAEIAKAGEALRQAVGDPEELRRRINATFAMLEEVKTARRPPSIPVATPTPPRPKRRRIGFLP